MKDKAMIKYVSILYKIVFNEGSSKITITRKLLSIQKLSVIERYSRSDWSYYILTQGRVNIGTDFQRHYKSQNGLRAAWRLEFFLN